MNSSTIIEIVDKLVGSIYPSGEDSIDREILSNVKIYGEIFIHMYDRLSSIHTTYKGSTYLSEKIIVKEIENILNNIR